MFIPPGSAIDPPYLPRSRKRKRGPGAPRGNFNGLRSGRSSRQIKLLIQALSALPGLEPLQPGSVRFRRLLVDAVRADDEARREAVEEARRILDPFRPERRRDRLYYRMLLAASQELRKG